MYRMGTSLFNVAVDILLGSKVHGRGTALVEVVTAGAGVFTGAESASIGSAKASLILAVRFRKYMIINSAEIETMTTEKITL